MKTDKKEFEEKFTQAGGIDWKWSIKPENVWFWIERQLKKERAGIIAEIDKMVKEHADDNSQYLKSGYCIELAFYKEIISDGKLFRYWAAWYYNSDGKRKQKHFNIDKLGDDKARELAIKKASIARRWDKIETYYIEDK